MEPLSTDLRSYLTPTKEPLQSPVKTQPGSSVHEEQIFRDNHPRKSNVVPESDRAQPNRAEVIVKSVVETSRDRYVNSFDLPGASKHPILRMDIQTFRKTSVDVLMAPYGEAEGGPTCGDDFGNSLIRRWRETRKTNCAASSTGAGSQSPLNSKIDCFLMRQHHHHGNGDNLCLMENVAVNMGIYGDDSFTRPIIDHYVHTRHAAQPYPAFPRGFLAADCNIQSEHWNPRVMPGWNVDLTTNAFKSLKDFADANTVTCSEWIEHPVLMQERDTFANFFHDSEDFVNVFIAMAVLQWKPEDTQLFLMDLYPQGPFWEMWSEVFNQGKAAHTAWDLRNRFGSKEAKKPHYVCFKSLAMGIYGPAAPTTICSWDHPCKHTALVRAYSDYVIRGLDLQHLTHYAQSEPSKEVVVTYMSRRPSKEWPEKKYCDSENSFFRCELWENFGPRNLGRMVRNDDEVSRALKTLESESFPNGARVRIQTVDFNILTFKEQITVDLQTDIMVGPHGAGLMHNIFMRDRASLIELFVDGSSANRHFHNLAGWYGRKYDGVSISNPIPTSELLELVRRHVRDMNLQTY